MHSIYYQHVTWDHYRKSYPGTSAYISYILSYTVKVCGTKQIPLIKEYVRTADQGIYNTEEVGGGGGGGGGG